MKRLLSFIPAMLLLASCSVTVTTAQSGDGGVYRSTDQGEHWEQKVFVRQVKKKTYTIAGYQITGMMASPSNADELTVTTSANGMYRTTDNAQTWSATSIATGNIASFTYDAANTALQYAATGSALLKSADSGASWSIVYSDPRKEAVTAIAVDWSDDRVLYAGTSGGTLLKSTNYGSDWQIETDLDTSITRILLSPTTAAHVFLVSADHGLYRSTDNGKGWTQMAALNAYAGGTQVYSIVFSPQSSQTLYAGTAYGLLRSNDEGTSWTPIKTLVPYRTLPIRTVALDATNVQRLYFTVGNQLHISDDDGHTWRTVNLPTKKTVTTLLQHRETPTELLFGTMKLQK